jgi:heme A synthase
MSNYSPRLARFCWIFCGYLIAVILFGAWVRISGAGAGCGNHWPTCHGEVIPPAPSVKTMIEFTHRLTSGLSGILGLVAVGWAFRIGSPARYWSVGMMLFLLLEGFIGAVLVKKELVENDASLSRAIVISLHLVNTLLLMLCATVMALRANTAVAVRRGALRWLLAAFVLVSMTGAVTALGDTLFPKQPALDGNLLAQLREDITPSQHFLVRLRALHPLLAVVVAAVAAWVFGGLQRRRTSSVAGVALSLVVAQTLLGVLNIALAAPPWMQIAHLLTANALWVATVMLWQGE